MLISDIDIVKKYCGGLLWSPSQLRGAVAFNCHAWIPGKKMPPVVGEMEQRCTHWCKHGWGHPDPVAATTVSPGTVSCCFFQFFSTCAVSFFFLSPCLFLLQLPCFPKSSWSWGLSVIICNSRTKVGCLTLCFGGGPSYFGRDVFLMHEWLT